MLFIYLLFIFVHICYDKHPIILSLMSFKSIVFSFMYVWSFAIESCISRCHGTYSIEHMARILWTGENGTDSRLNCPDRDQS